ncbi:hypothetical protein N9H60_03450 [Flavimaricola sp.]|nr:hypothetical protein [Flavimaricola sp.]MDA9020215.1 hypothetical protein [Flavimaricola sp.]
MTKRPKPGPISGITAPGPRMTPLGAAISAVLFAIPAGVIVTVLAALLS